MTMSTVLNDDVYMNAVSFSKLCHKFFVEAIFIRVPRFRSLSLWRQTHVSNCSFKRAQPNDIGILNLWFHTYMLTRLRFKHVSIHSVDSVSPTLWMCVHVCVCVCEHSALMLRKPGIYIYANYANALCTLHRANSLNLIST